MPTVRDGPQLPARDRVRPDAVIRDLEVGRRVGNDHRTGFVVAKYQVLRMRGTIRVCYTFHERIINIP